MYLSLTSTLRLLPCITSPKTVGNLGAIYTTTIMVMFTSIGVKWIKRICTIYKVEMYSAIKKNEIMPSAAIWMDPEISLLSQVRERQISHISFICGIFI